MKAAADNREAAIKAFQNNLKRINNAIRGVPPKQQEDQGNQTEFNVADNLANFETLLPDTMADFDSQRHPQTLQSRLEDIIRDSATIADLPTTDRDRRDQIVESCESLRNALQGLLREYMDGGFSKGGSNNLNDAINALVEKNRNLAGHLHRAAGDQIGDAFLNAELPFMVLYIAAKEGKAAEVKSNAPAFSAHAERMVKSARLLAQMAPPEKAELKAELNRAADEVEELVDPVINSAILLAADYTSPEYINNMEIIK